MSNEQTKGYGVCRSIEDAHTVAAQAKAAGLQGCYPSAAVVLSDALVSATSVEVGAIAELPFNYQAEAISTLSNQFHGDMVSLMLFDNTLSRAIEVLKELDAIKKTLFYGKPLPEHIDPQAQHAFETCAGLPAWFKNASFGEMMIHGVVGSATEVGEQLEALYATIFQGQDFDEINIKEETGDQFWYNAVVAYGCGFSFDDAQRINIAKLRARYPNKFTEYDAINRNLVEERRILSK